MTRPCYPSGCAAAFSSVPPGVGQLSITGRAPKRLSVAGNPSNAWNVSFNNGNVNNNNRNNPAAVRLVRASPWSAV